MPKGIREAQTIKDLADLGAHGPSCFGRQPVRVPRDGQLPELAKSNEWALWEASHRAPVIDMLFRPEEKHGASGIWKIVPPMSGGDSEMRNADSGGWLTGLYRQRHGFATARAARLDPCILVKSGRDAVTIPDAVGKVRAPSSCNHEPGRRGRERRSHDDLASVAGEIDKPSLPEPLKAVEDIGRLDAQRRNDLGRERWSTEVDRRRIDVVTKLLISYHGWILHRSWLRRLADSTHLALEPSWLES